MQNHSFAFRHSIVYYGTWTSFRLVFPLVIQTTDIKTGGGDCYDPRGFPAYSNTFTYLHHMFAHYI